MNKVIAIWKKFPALVRGAIGSAVVAVVDGVSKGGIHTWQQAVSIAMGAVVGLSIHPSVTPVNPPSSAPKA